MTMTITRAEAQHLLGMLEMYGTPAHAAHQCTVQLRAIEPYTDGQLSRIRHLLRALQQAEARHPERAGHWRDQLSRIASTSSTVTVHYQPAEETQP